MDLPNISAPVMQFSANHYAAKTARNPYATFLRNVVAYRFGLFTGIGGLVVIAQLSLISSTAAGMGIVAVIISLLVGVALRTEALRSLALAVAIIPIAMFATVAAAPAGVLQQSLFMYSIMLALALAYRLLLGKPEATLSRFLDANSYAAYIPGALLLGGALGVAGFGLLRHTFAFTGLPVPEVMMAAVLFAVAEELLFHGLIQRTAANVLHPVMAAVLSAITFAVIMGGSIQAFVYGLGAGVVLGAIYYQKQSLVLTTIVNLTAKLVFIALLALPFLK